MLANVVIAPKLTFVAQIGYRSEVLLRSPPPSPPFDPTIEQVWFRICLHGKQLLHQRTLHPLLARAENAKPTIASALDTKPTITLVLVRVQPPITRFYLWPALNALEQIPATVPCAIIPFWTPT